jgi:hypothetical protein
VSAQTWSVLSQKSEPVLRPDTRQDKDLEQDDDTKGVILLKRLQTLTTR